LFSSGKDNYNVHILDISTQKKRVIANNSVDERLAKFSFDASQIAYISLASGNEEIWLASTNNKRRTKLTQFNDSRHYVDLMWSPNGDYLVALTLNEIHLIDASTGQFERLKIPQTQIKGVSFKSALSIAYSIKEKNQWQVYSYQLETGSVLAEDKKWQFIQYNTNAENTLWLDQRNQLFFGEQQESVINKKVSADKLLNGRQFNLRKRGDVWFWFERDGQAKIQSYSEQSRELTTLTYTDIGHFDIANDLLLFGHIEKVNANIYQTQALDRK
jgi:hypothetical protein